MFHELDFGQHVNFVINAHQNLSKSLEGTTRRFDGKTPYSIHPLWCATMIAAESSLPEDIREEGLFVLLYHDVLEDTVAFLSDDLPVNVRRSIEGMTFSHFTEEIVEVWNRDPKIRLFKLYDKVSNLLDATWMTDEQREQYSMHVKKLTNDVEENFGNLNIVRIAKTMVEQFS